MKYNVPIVIFCILFGVIKAQNDSLPPIKEKTFRINGYIKNLNGIMLFQNQESIQWGLLHNRINAKWTPKLWLTSSAEIRNRVLFGEAVKYGMYPANLLGLDKGITDLTFLPFDKKYSIMVSSVERLWTRIDFNKFELTIGRQRINWGLNLVWNPNDVFNTYSFMDFDYEERPGSDAIRLKMNLKDMSSLEIAVKPGKRKNDDIYALQYKFNKVGYDFQFLGGMYEKDALTGFGFAGSIGNVGVKGETSYFHYTDNPIDTVGQLSCSAEIDYTIYGKIYLNTSYLYNSNGLDFSSPNSLELFNNNMLVSSKNLSPSKHSAFMQLKSIYSSVFSFGVSTIYFFELKGMYVFPAISYSINDKWETSFFVQSFWLKENKLENKMNNTLIRAKYSF